MTAKKKAKELFDKFENFSDDVPHCNWNRNTKYCVLIAIDEILKEINNIEDQRGASFRHSEEITLNHHEEIQFWNDVKTELEKL